MKGKKQSRPLFLVLFLLVLAVMPISGCSNAEKSDKPDTQANAGRMEESTGLKAVSIVVDLVDGGGPPDAITKTLNKVPGFGEDFIYQIEVLPELDGQERDTALTRVRTEVMAGAGPDLFLCGHRLYGNNAGPDFAPLFKFPVQAMSNRLFLPLDGYIEEAEYIDWDSLQPTVMDAGRNEEGQLILPLTYTFQVTLFDHSYTPEAQFPMTWEQMTEDPDPNIRASSNGYIYNIIGNLADYSKDAPAFSEEELLGWVTKNYETWQTVPEDSRDIQCVWLDREYLSDPDPDPDADADADISLNGEQEYTMIPVYNISGGVTANITTFAAINRNARYPDEAFHIIDYLLDPEVQQTSALFQYRMEGLPVYIGTGNSDTPAGSYWQMNDVNYKAVTEAQEQIDVANFPGPLDASVWTVLWYDEEARKKSAHEQYVLMEMLLAES